MIEAVFFYYGGNVMKNGIRAPCLGKTGISLSNYKYG